MKKVVNWISEEETKDMTESCGGFGGFFQDGMRWQDYLDNQSEDDYIYLEAIRENVVANEIKFGGDYHQYGEHGVPVFDDGTVGSFSYRAWGDLMAAIWSEEEGKNYSYMNFYMSCLMGDDDDQE